MAGGCFEDLCKEMQHAFVHQINNTASPTSNKQYDPPGIEHQGPLAIQQGLKKKYKAKCVRGKRGCVLTMCTQQQANSTDDLTHCNNEHTLLSNNNASNGSQQPENTTEVIVKRWTRFEKAGTAVHCGTTYQSLPNRLMAPLAMDVFASYSGPDKGLAIVPDLEKVQSRPRFNNSLPPVNNDIAGAPRWNNKSRKAYGISISLYDQHPVNGKMSGDPIADSFAVCARQNSGILAVADGVNWGEKSKIAARCAVYGAMKYLNEKLFGRNSLIKQTNEVFFLLRSSLDLAHQCILNHAGGLTTLCVAAVLPIKDSRQFIVCIVNVGDSLAYVFSKHHGIREITTGSHDISSERDIRDAGGALGPVSGCEPELNNLTCSMTFVDPGDIVFLTTDGVSDNFDPVVTKIAVATDKQLSDSARERNSSGTSSHNSADNARSSSTSDTPRNSSTSDTPKSVSSPDDMDTDPEVIVDDIPRSPEMGCRDGKPEMFPHERHQYAVKQMERIIHEFELNTETAISAQELCGALVQHVLALTDPKRKVLENPELYGKKLRSKERKQRDSEIVAQMSSAAGKLDHASIVSYEVGCYHGNDDENYESDEEQRGDKVDEDAKLRHVDTIVEPKSPNIQPAINRVYESNV